MRSLEQPRIGFDRASLVAGPRVDESEVFLRLRTLPVVFFGGDGLKYCVLVFLAVRIGLSLLSVVGVGLIEPRGGDLPVVAGWPIAPLVPGWHNAVNATERQDAARYLSIATQGYRPDDGSAAFFPLYPSVVRAVSWLPLVGPLGAALLVSNAAFLAALVMLHALTRFEFGSESMARRAVLTCGVRLTIGAAGRSRAARRLVKPEAV